jgi:uncharacterized protein YecE (DUF72 family)
LQEWAERLTSDWSDDEDAYVFFNNDPRACALRDACVFASILDDLGRAHSRVPRRSEIRVGDELTAAWATSS